MTNRRRDGCGCEREELGGGIAGQAVGPRTRATVLQQVHSGAMQQQAMKNFSIRPNEAERMGQVLNAAGPRSPVRSPLDREAAMEVCCWIAGVSAR
jgi:hypothetical protein